MSAGQRVPTVNTAVRLSANATSQGTGETFGQFSTKASIWLGSRWAFLAAVLIIVGWAATGPLFQYSNTWQLVINTGTTIVTFLMVFLIQNTQNRDSRAINLKLDELIHSIDKAENEMMDIESLSDEELSELHKRYEVIRAECMARAQRTKS